jgi:hypothetical protein
MGRIVYRYRLRHTMGKKQSRSQREDTKRERWIGTERKTQRKGAEQRKHQVESR